MLEHLYHQRQSVAPALVSLKTDFSHLNSDDYEAVVDHLWVLSPFHQATVEISEEKRVSALKVRALINMLHDSILCMSDSITSKGVDTLCEGKSMHNKIT